MRRAQDRLDFLICRPIIGIPLFFSLMYAVFFLSFSSAGEWMSEILGKFLFMITQALEKRLLSFGTHPQVLSILNGILQNTASVLAYLPQTVIFFFFIKMLEECGYLARAVFAADSLLARFGLSGNALLPVVLGMGCHVSALTASRELDANETGILRNSIPFLICNARLPVLFFLTDAFFPKHKSLAAFVFYAFSLLLFFLCALLSRKRKNAPPLIVRLPPLRFPALRIQGAKLLSESRAYVIRTATVIFLCAVFFHLGISLTPQLRFTEYAEESLFYLLGEKISFLFAPLGFGKAPFSCALLAGFFARENLMFTAEALTQRPLNTLLTLPARISFTAFSMAYLPCYSAVRAVSKQTNGKQSVRFLFHTFFMAYAVSFILYVIASFLVNFVEI